ncbi:FecR domain-containing protein [Siphonobacter sp. SORGH_AS_0500]|uniref:FecR family protein n=1 Tax=Siphonobacter sp. SORGH_AS_0500 TaxID=1864824 RepID=UPI002860F056|nr:FecR domain-containing protein [Siphonobacter sp. SORGH_AS_0500]MDR6197685.1 transmembrane sensor [Siphonobacter sp. SORGH_AS_0500]
MTTFDTLEEFLANDAFREWILGRRPQDYIYWQEWLSQNPHKRELYEQAAALCLVLNGDTQPLQEAQHASEIEQIKQSLHEAKERSILEVRAHTLRPRLKWLAPLAGVAALVLIGFFLKNFIHNDSTISSTVPSVEEVMASKDRWQKVVNTGKSDQLVTLTDGSSVLLAPGGQLWHNLSAQQREIYLIGEGFFEVVRDTTRPFFVYTSVLSTRVLGTSFQVQATQNQNLAYVKVKTGKVTVTSMKDPGQYLVLEKNEQVKLNIQTNQLTKQILTSNLHRHHSTSILNDNQNFEFTPVTEVLNRLQHTYHTKIEFNEHNLQGCTFTGDLNGIPFAEKIRLICSAVEASYEKQGDTIYVTGHSCNP